MNRSASKLGVFVVFVLLLSAVDSWAQSSGAITGTLVDPRGALIAGASVQAFDEAKGLIVRTTTSGADGLFQLQPLQPGKYSVRVKANGMKEMEKTKPGAGFPPSARIGRVRGCRHSKDHD